MSDLRLGLSITEAAVDAVIIDSTNTCVSSLSHEPGATLSLSLDAILADLGRELLSRVSTAAVASTVLSDQLRRVEGLQRVGALRIGMTSTAIPPLSGWPRALAESIAGPQSIVAGASELDGSPLAPLDVDAVKRFADQCKNTVEAIAVTAVFSPIAPHVESEAIAILRAELGADIRIIPSHLIGGFGLLERENATILNAALAAAGQFVIEEVVAALRRQHSPADLFIAQNDGNLLGADVAETMPVRLLDSRLATSVRGAGLISGLSDALVVDRVGDRVRAGVLREGEVALEYGISSIAGVRMQHWLPIGFDDAAHGNPVDRLRRHARDAALLDLTDRSSEASLRTASAWGAATAPVSASVWAIVNSPDASLTPIRQRAIDEAILAGADPSHTTVVSVVETPLSYMPHGHRVFIRAAGPPFGSGSETHHPQ